MLDALLSPDRPLRRLDDGLWSAMPEGDAGARYDGRAAMYDRVVGSAVYNRLVWGARTADYRAFAAEAIAGADGPLLDAGCGSCVFTADAYRATARPVLLVDRSIDMLRAARRRIARDGPLPAHVTLLQADLFDLPLRSASFATVLSMGMLHLFDDLGSLAARLAPLIAAGGSFFASSLVTDRAVGRFALRQLHRAGEVAAPRSADQVRAAIAPAFDDVRLDRRGSMAYLRA